MGNKVNVLKLLGTFKFWKEMFIMTIGMMIAAAAVYYFLMPSNLIIGTISGLSMVLHELVPVVSVSVFITAINVVLLVLAYFIVSKEFGAKTVYTALILGPLIDFWDWILPSSKLATHNAYTSMFEGCTGTSVMGDPWLDLCCFVLLLSASQAVLFSINASTGGLDILAKIVNKFLHFDIGASVSVAGACICCTAFAINTPQMVVIGLIGTWINGLVVDYFTASLNKRKRVCIISKDYEQIRQFILNDLDRGCSLYKVTGGYTGDETVEIQSLLTQNEFSDLMKFMGENNISNFTTAGNVSEVYGLWTRHSKNKHRRKMEMEK